MNAEQLDQAASITPAAAGTDSKADNPGRRAASNATTENSHQAHHQKPQDAAQDAITATSTTEAGNVLGQSTAVPIGKASGLMTPSGVPLARGPDGRLYNPAKWESPPPKAQPATVASSKPAQANDLEQFPAEKAGIRGLDAIPKGWPDLPGSVSLSSEIAWVQENRLAVVKELPSGGVKVDLTKAYAPAPSRSALSWLETSIRSYAKFIEVAARTASVGQDEQAFVRQERMRIEEIRAILTSMES